MSEWKRQVSGMGDVVFYFRPGTSARGSSTVTIWLEKRRVVTDGAAVDADWLVRTIERELNA